MSAFNEIDLKNIEAREILPGYTARFIHSEHMTIAYWDIIAEAELPEHAHIHEQVVNVLSGTFELTIDGEPVVLDAGMVLVIPSNVKHSGRAITNCRIIDVFSPVREDYL